MTLSTLKFSNKFPLTINNIPLVVNMAIVNIGHLSNVRANLYFNKSVVNMVDIINHFAPTIQISLNVGYNITARNTPDKPDIPIGYVYDHDNPMVEQVPFSKRYRDNNAVLQIMNNRFKISRATDFYRDHTTKNVSFMVFREPELIYSSSEEIIDMKNSMKDYDQAIECGPILIWDSIPIVTGQSLLNDFNLAQIDGSNIIEYKLSRDSNNSRLYFSETNQLLPLNATVPMSHSILCVDNNDNMFICCIEGINDAVNGLDLANTTSLLMKFNPKHAVVIDGANGVVCLTSFNNINRLTNDTLAMNTKHTSNYITFWNK